MKNENPKNVILFFTGSAIKDRIEILNRIAQKIKSYNLSPDFYIYNFGKKKLKGNDDYHFKVIEQPLSFKESILKIISSEFLLDLHNPAHNGLSFRTFESIGYRKKLITNNAIVKNFEFYNPNNIFVFEGENFAGLEKFINTPYEEIPAEMRSKYSFTTWISNILEN